MCNKKRGVLPSLFVMRNTLASLCEGGTGCRKSLSLRASPQGRGSTPPAVLRSHSLASPFGRGGRAQRGRRGQTMTIPALSITCGDSSPKGRAKGLHSSTECLHVIRFGRGRAPPLHSVYRICVPCGYSPRGRGRGPPSLTAPPRSPLPAPPRPPCHGSRTAPWPPARGGGCTMPRPALPRRPGP